MNRLQFSIVTTLSGIIAFSIFLQIILVRISANDDLRAQQAQAALQQGQLCFTRLQQIAGRIAQVSQQQNDQGLKDLLQRQNITINSGTNTNAAPIPADPTTPSTR